jgi:hypothetical protein
MIHLEHFEVTTRGRAFKTVTCESCRAEFVYLLIRHGAGFAASAMFYDRAGAKERAAAQAEAELRRALAREQDPVPCPGCGWYQQSMVPLVRAAHRGWMRFVGALLLYLAAILGGLAALAVLTRRAGDRAAVGTALGLAEAAAWAAAIGCGLVLARRLLARRVEPNDGDPEARKELGRRLARTREEFDRLLSAAGDATAEPGPDRGVPPTSSPPP